MKLLLLSFIVILLSNHCTIAQSSSKKDSVSAAIADEISKIFATEILMDIDTTVFTENSGNIYVATDPHAMIMAIVAPQSFEKAKEHMEKKSKKEDYKETDKGEFEENSKKILYKKGILKKDGKKYMMEQYVVAANEKQTIFITGMYDPKAKNSIANAIRKAAVSARLK
jgi:hypothetical protein